MQNDNRIGEECGVFAIYDPDGDCARTTYYGLYALQHRGQESCGIAVNNNRDITHYKDMGLVNDVFNDEILTKLDGKMAVGHVRKQGRIGTRTKRYRCYLPNNNRHRNDCLHNRQRTS